MFDVHRTAGSVAEKLKAFGCDEVVPGIGRTGVVGVIKGRKDGAGGRARVIGLRADMDALPIEEATGLPYKSTVPGKMHACGHDGHTAMLLGAAKYLAETRNFGGTAVVIFQPAEEGGGGGREMVNDGMMDRFGIEEVYGMHNYPGMPVGQFGMRPGPIMAAADYVSIEIEGKGAHAARPHLGIDPILVGAQMVNQLQSIVSRNIDPLEAGVVSICVFQAGTTNNVIPQTAKLAGTIRSLTEEGARSARDAREARSAKAWPSCTARPRGCAIIAAIRSPSIMPNRPHSRRRSRPRLPAPGRVDDELPPMMGAEDFSYMLNARPGAFIFVGNGENSAGLHHPAYDFNDEVIPLGSILLGAAGREGDAGLSVIRAAPKATNPESKITSR